MKFTLEWLREFLHGDASDAQIIDALTALGLEVESVGSPGDALTDFIVAEITETAPHPQADKLQLCKVHRGGGTILNIVCGAPNARPGIKVALAPEGVTVPSNGMAIKRSKIRGEESCGMLCSASELDLGVDSDGIMELSQDLLPGTPLADALELNDVVVEIGITPNRGDCLGVYGIARDLAAAGLGALSRITPQAINGRFDSPVNVSLMPASACGAFYGCYIKDVNNAGALPPIMQRRLKAVGQRLISPAVDLTNYMLIEFGRPLHVFDADKLHGDLCARPAVPEEKFVGLDDVTYTLPGTATVIADDSGAQAVGGVIGALASGCDADTKNIFLEVALFDAESVAKTGRLLNIHTESRRRFERGVDSGFVETALHLAARRLMQICGGDASRPVVAKRESTRRSGGVPFRSGATKRLTGVDVSDAQAGAILRKLGFAATKDLAGFIPPTWRHDVTCEADLVEEVMRVIGYDAIVETPLPPIASLPAINDAAALTARVKLSFIGRQLHEALCWSFISDAQKDAFGFTDAVTISNPISQEWRHMRPSLLPNLLRTVAENNGRRLSNFGLCETGTVFFGSGLSEQRSSAAAVRVGCDQPAAGALSTPEFTVFDAKRDFFTALSECGLSEESCRLENAVPAYFRPGRSASVYLGKKLLGTFGEIHPRICKGEGIKERVSACEIFIDALPSSNKKGKTARPALKLSPYQASDRDFCFIMDEAVNAGELTRRVGKADKDNIETVRIFDIYRGDNVGEGQKSVALTVRIRPQKKVLTDDDLQRISDAVVDAASKCGAKLRA